MSSVIENRQALVAEGSLKHKSRDADATPGGHSASDTHAAAQTDGFHLALSSIAKLY